MKYILYYHARYGGVNRMTLSSLKELARYLKDKEMGPRCIKVDKVESFDINWKMPTEVLHRLEDESE